MVPFQSCPWSPVMISSLIGAVRPQGRGCAARAGADGRACVAASGRGSRPRALQSAPRPARSARRRGRPCRARRSGCSRGPGRSRTRGTPSRGSAPASLRTTVSRALPTAASKIRGISRAVLLADREPGDVPLGLQAEPAGSPRLASGPCRGRSRRPCRRPLPCPCPWPCRRPCRRPRAIPPVPRLHVDALELDEQRVVRPPGDAVERRRGRRRPGRTARAGRSGPAAVRPASGPGCRRGSGRPARGRSPRRRPCWAPARGAAAGRPARRSSPWGRRRG